MSSGLESIRNAIIERAKERAAAIIKEAKGERNRLLDEAREDAKVSGFQLLEEAKAEAQVRYEEKLGAIRTDLRRQVLTKREEMIESAWSQTMDRLREHVRTPEYASELKRMVVSTAKQVEEGSFRISANQRDLEMLSEYKGEIEESLGESRREMVIGDVLDCIGGIQISDPDGKVVLDRTYEARIRRLKPELRSKLAEILVGELD